ncbi:MAG: SCO family protein [Steroidobacteraceae bacterium]
MRQERHPARGRLLVLLVLLFSTHAQAFINVRNVRWDQHPGAQLPLQLSFRDESNRPVALRQYFGSMPVVLVLVYFSCPELCPEVLHGVTESLRGTGLAAGHDYVLLAVSIDPRDTPERAEEKKLQLLGDHTLPEGAHFLSTTTDSAAVLARVVGFQYLYDTEHRQFAHAAGFLVADPRGEISRYFFGVRYPSTQVRAAIINAGHGQIASLADQLLLLCYHFDPTQGRYTLAILNVLRIVAVAALLGAAFTWWRLTRSRVASRPVRTNGS